MLVMYVIMKCHPVRGCIKVGNFILLHYHWMKSIAKQSTNKHYSTMQRTKEYMFVVNLEFFMFVSHQRYTWNLKIDGGIQSPLLTFKCLQKKNLWLDLFFHFCFRRTVVKFFENANNNYMNIGYYIESMWLKRKKKFSYREFVTVLYFFFFKA